MLPQGQRATQGRRLLNDIVVREEDEVHIMKTCRIDIVDPRFEDVKIVLIRKASSWVFVPQSNSKSSKFLFFLLLSNRTIR